MASDCVGTSIVVDISVGVTGEEIAALMVYSRSSVPLMREALTPVSSGASLTEASSKVLVAAVDAVPSVTL